MVLKNGHEERAVIPADFTMKSVDPARIQLPFIGRAWDELCLEALWLTLDRKGPALDFGAWRYEKVVADLDVQISFNLQRKVMRPAAILYITAVDGEHVNGRIPMRMEREEWFPILDQFFQGGGKGLKNCYLDHYTEVFNDWK